MNYKKYATKKQIATLKGYERRGKIDLKRAGLTNLDALDQTTAWHIIGAIINSDINYIQDLYNIQDQKILADKIKFNDYINYIYNHFYNPNSRDF